MGDELGGRYPGQIIDKVPCLTTQADFLQMGLLVDSNQQLLNLDSSDLPPELFLPHVSNNVNIYSYIIIYIKNIVFTNHVNCPNRTRFACWPPAAVVMVWGRLRQAPVSTTTPRTGQHTNGGARIPCPVSGTWRKAQYMPIRWRRSRREW